MASYLVCRCLSKTYLRGARRSWLLTAMLPKKLECLASKKTQGVILRGMAALVSMLKDSET